MAFAAYATRPEFESWTQLSDQVDVPVIDDVLDSVTRWIDKYCDTHFWQDIAAARTFTSNCGYDIAIDDLVSITTLKTDATGDGTFETTWSASDYQLQPVNRPNGEPFTTVVAVGSQMFPTWNTRLSRANRIEITGTWGWAAVPDQVKQACLLQAGRWLKRRFSPEGVAGFGDLGAVRITRLDPDVEAMLQNLTTTARTTGVLIA